VNKIMIVENEKSFLEWKQYNKADIVIGIGCRMSGPDTLSQMSKNIAETTIEVFNYGFADRIGFSGGRTWKMQLLHFAPTEASAMANLVKPTLNTPTKIIVENRSIKSSIANCYEILQLIKENHWKKIFVVNIPDRFYLRRFSYTFQKVAQKMKIQNLTVFILPANLPMIYKIAPPNTEFDYLFSRPFTADTDLWWLNTKRRFFWWNVISGITTSIFLTTGYWRKMVDFRE